MISDGMNVLLFPKWEAASLHSKGSAKTEPCCHNRLRYGAETVEGRKAEDDFADHIALVNGPDGIVAAVPRAGAVVAHDENVAFGHGIRLSVIGFPAI